MFRFTPSFLPGSLTVLQAVFDFASLVDLPEERDQRNDPMQEIFMPWDYNDLEATLQIH
jgi:hypothetical protein